MNAYQLVAIGVKEGVAMGITKIVKKKHHQPEPQNSRWYQLQISGQLPA
jgi:hypothetical protein